MTVSHTQVLVVGAGPTGLTLALWLARQGIKVRILDRSSGPGETSRALAVQARTLEYHRMLGTLDDVLEAGVRVNTLRVLTPRGGDARLDLSSFGKGVSKFDYAFALPQDIHEKILVSHLERLGISVERETELISFNEYGGTVTATVRQRDMVEKIQAAYLVGSDGARSMVRRALGIEFQGGTYDQSFYVADVEGEAHRGNDEMDVVLGAYGFAIVLPVRQSGTIRLIGVVPKKYETMPKITFDAIRAEVERDSRVRVNKIRWFSTYRVHHRVAVHFRKGRVFIAGDAGHIHSPAGGQGMNTGIGDAVNLAWKLAAVLQERADPRILDTYETERLAFAKMLIDGTDKAFRFATSRSPIVGFFRRNIFTHIVRRLLRIPKFARAFFEMNAQTRIAYRDSIISSGRAEQVMAGERLPYVASDASNAQDNFASFDRLDWQVHVYGDVQPEFSEAVRARGFSLKVFAWTNAVAKTGIPGGAAFLLRPDGHIGLASASQNPRAFNDYVARFNLKPRERAHVRSLTNVAA